MSPAADDDSRFALRLPTVLLAGNSDLSGDEHPKPEAFRELTALLLPKRMELLRFVADHPGLSVRALAGALKRDYKNVHTDVAREEGERAVRRDRDSRAFAQGGVALAHGGRRHPAVPVFPG